MLGTSCIYQTKIIMFILFLSLHLWCRVYGLCTWALQRDLVLFSNYQGLNLRLLDTLRLEVLFTFWFLSSKIIKFWVLICLLKKNVFTAWCLFPDSKSQPNYFVLSLGHTRKLIPPPWYKGGVDGSPHWSFDMLQYSKYLHIRTNGLRTPGWNLANKAPFLTRGDAQEQRYANESLTHS